ncbi:MAG: hypothetical protein HC875_14840 [Anaerolineales bacterium]|nr:hypothetical protein [Anaerolineales bacterium]
MSANGQYITFESTASNLVSGDTNGMAADVFIHNRQTGQIGLISVTSSGTSGNDFSYAPSISTDGRYVTFASDASNLVSGDTNGMEDVFIRDRQTNQTSLVSIASNNTQGTGNSFAPAISSDGCCIAFESYASNLVSGDTNGVEDIFVRDWQTGQTSLISITSNGTSGNAPSYTPSISADGRYVVFASDASDLVNNDTNGAVADVFVRDRQTGQTSLVSVASNSTQGNDFSSFPSISADGCCVAFVSQGTNLVSSDTNNSADVFIRNLKTNQTRRVSISSGGVQGNGTSNFPSISTDGRYISFSSTASNLVSGDTNGNIDIFVHDLQTGKTTRVSVTSNGTQVNGNTVLTSTSISANGHYVAFVSSSSSLVSGDTNGKNDVFIHNYLSGSTTVYLPFILKPAPTNLFIQNLTLGIVSSYKVHNTPQGDIICSNITPGLKVFCGSFTPGIYMVSVSTVCGADSKLITFSSGVVTRTVSC